MAHAKLNLQRMYDWIVRSIDADAPLPTDAAICAEFGFESSESARTLLAELADAGRITIRGYGETRSISIGRTKGALLPAKRPIPSVVKPDVSVDRLAARLLDIASRGPRPARATIAANADALLKAVTPKPPAARPHPTIEEPKPMPAKTVQLPASAAVAIACLEAHAKGNNLPIGAAAADLIERGASKVLPDTVPASPAIGDLSVADLLDIVRQRLEKEPDISADLAAAIERADAAEARAKAAEDRLAAAKALFA